MLKKKQFVDDLILAPWWLSLILAGVSYIALGTIIPLMSSESLAFKMIISIAKPLAPFAAIFFLFTAVFSFIRRISNRKRLKKQESIDTLNDLSWKRFEDVTGEFFRQRGYTVGENLGGGADGGVDLRLRKNGALILVQCKRWKRQKVKLPTVRELLGAMTAESAQKGILVTTSSFTSEAVKFARNHNIQLIDGSTLSQEIAQLNAISPKQVKLPPPLPTTVEKPPACPTCGTNMVKRTARKGANAGNQFWGCSHFPKCRGIRNI